MITNAFVNRGGLDLLSSNLGRLDESFEDEGDVLRRRAQISDICTDIWSRQKISGHAAKTHHIGIYINHR